MSEVLSEIETQLSAVEDAVDIEAIASRVSPKLAIALTGVGALVAGAVAGYFISTHLLRKRYQTMADQQVEEVRARYARDVETIDPPDLSALAQAIREEMTAEQEKVQEIAAKNGYVGYDKVHKTPEGTIIREDQSLAASLPTPIPETHNVFTEVDTEFDMDREMRRRAETPNEPYVITEEEFVDGELDYEQVQLTYYDGDGVLADDMEQKIDNVDAKVGIQNMLRFGHGSESENIVFIRNNIERIDIEVAKATESYAKAVLGYRDADDDESATLKHSESRGRRSRFDDE